MRNSTCVYVYGVLQSLFQESFIHELADPLNVSSAWTEPQNVLTSIHHLLFFQWPVRNRVFWREGWGLNTHRDHITLLSPMGGLPQTGLVASAVKLLLYLFMDKPKKAICRAPKMVPFWSKTLLILKGVKTQYLPTYSAGSTCTSFNLHSTS